ncbi:MAG: hypothetical protein ACJAZ2_000922 [Glaciecola sp.]|jgi:hypothetical protein
MKLDFVDNLNEYGDNMIRLFNFNKEEAGAFKQCLTSTVIQKKQALVVNELEFVEAQNCSLTLIISDENYGIHSNDKQNFVCELTLKGYEDIVSYIEPFCKKESKAYRMLYDVDSSTDFIFMPAGT